MYRAYIGRIRRGKVDDYIKAHERVWPELIDAMKRAGVERESCFVFGNHIFVYVEAKNIDMATERLAREPLPGDAGSVPHVGIFGFPVLARRRDFIVGGSAQHSKAQGGYHVYNYFLRGSEPKDT